MIYCFRINPFGMGPRAEGENLYPNVNLSNIASWYRHLVQADPKQNAAMLNSLRESLDGFSFLQLEPAGENVRLLTAEFTHNSGKASKFYFNELSDGQRCLICLYTVLHFVLAKGGTVILDEPDNFISLREIQPWLTAVTDAVDEVKDKFSSFLITQRPSINGRRIVACGSFEKKVGLSVSRSFAETLRVSYPPQSLWPADGSVSNPSRVVVLGKDERHQRLVRRYLYKLG